MAKKRARKELEDADVPIASMIDIVFLLIIFFVVTASIDKEVQDEKVVLAAAPHGKPLKKVPSRSVTINVRANGELRIGMFKVSKESMIRSLNNSKSKYGGEFPIIIRADQNTQHGYVQEVMEAITSLQLYKVKFNAEVRKK